MTTVAGIDGCHAGWLCVTKDLASGKINARVLKRIDDILAISPRPEVVTVDIPIGLPDAGSRDCDLEARKRLGKPRSCSVFPAPIRPMLEAKSRAEACQIGQRVDGRKTSIQLWSILPKVHEVDTFLRLDSTPTNWIREVHPEICFWHWNCEKAMAHYKKSRQGQEERERLVIPSIGGGEYQSVRSIQPAGQYANDDLLDALAALWTAERIHCRRELVLPSNPPMDSCGLRMEMVA